MEESLNKKKFVGNWLKLTFRLIVGDHWDKVSGMVVGGDTTHRWCREIIRASLTEMENSSSKFLSSSISNIRSEIWKLRGEDYEEMQYPLAGVSVWENTLSMVFDMTRNLPGVKDKVMALKLAIIAGSFDKDEKKQLLRLKEKLFPEFFSLKDRCGDSETFDDINKAFYTFVDFLKDFGIDTKEDEKKMGERVLGTSDTWQAPASWCFGDFGDNDGQMEYPVDVLVTHQGDFLVLEENSKGKNTIQRLQKFDEKGLYQKTLLQRGQSCVTAMSHMALDNKDNVVVSLKDESGVGRVNVYNMQGACVLVVNVLTSSTSLPLFYTSLAVDKDGKIFVVEHNEMSVHVYGGQGDFITKFGQAGRSARPSIFNNISSITTSGYNETFVCDPYYAVQVFNSEGKFLRFFKPNEVTPTHVVVNAQAKEIYGVNRAAHALEVYPFDGSKVLRTVGGFGGELGKLWSPMGIAMTPGGLVAVAERESHRIQVLKI